MRATKDHGGMVTSFDELKNVDGATPAVLAALSSGFVTEQFHDSQRGYRGAQSGGAIATAGDSRNPLCFGGHVGIYCLSLRMGLRAAAVIAVFHDVLITLGFFSLFHYEISLTVLRRC